MNYLLFFTSALTIFSAMGLIASFMLTRTSRATKQRVFLVTHGGTSVRPDAKRKKEVQEAVFATVRWIRTTLGMSADSGLLDRFSRAGFKNGSHRDAYFAARMLGPVAAIAIASFIPSNRYFWMLALAAISYLVPDIALERMIKRRREKIRKSVPDAIDLLVICVDAGLGMDQAMLRVGQELGSSHPQIYEEFMQINREQRAGKLRIDAWQAMADRSKLPEIDAFVNMLMQTERFGTPIARALSNFGDGIRDKRRQRAEEMAAKTTVKIIFPLVLFIFPSMFIVLLGPAGIAIARGLAGTAQ
jgi:tight adherence protein C